MENILNTVLLGSILVLSVIILIKANKKELYGNGRGLNPSGMDCHDQQLLNMCQNDTNCVNSQCKKCIGLINTGGVPEQVTNCIPVNCDCQEYDNLYVRS